MIAFAGNSNTILILNVKKFKIKKRIDDNADSTFRMSKISRSTFSPVADSGIIQIFNWKTYKKIRRIKYDKNSISIECGKQYLLIGNVHSPMDLYNHVTG